MPLMARTTRRNKHPGVELAIREAGSQQALAGLLGCPQSAISKRLYEHVAVTAEWAIEVEKVLPAINRKDIRPDLWG